MKLLLNYEIIYCTLFNYIPHKQKRIFYFSATKYGYSNILIF